MKMFSDCSGPCLVCACKSGMCLAGHGDDDFSLADKAYLETLIQTGRRGGTSEGFPLTNEELDLVRTWLPKAPGESKPQEKPFCFSVITGYDVHRIPDGVPTNMEEANLITIDDNLITTLDGFIEGEPLLVQGFTGLCVAYACRSPEPCAYSKNKSMVYMLQFVDDRGEGEPPRWVCVGSGNMLALRKLCTNKS